MKLTLADVLTHNARVAAGRKGSAPTPASTEGCDRESNLHAQIQQECIRNGWLAFHGSMAHMSMRTPGEADFTICTKGKVFFVECKTKNGKLSKQQREIEAWLVKLGHKLNIVRSFEEFLDLMNGEK